ncbi:uncharacterized protein LOC126993828 isoform X2 [Eriocheir sinensis]|uniref:uncharacterized protein LOC126993828 isoform X2 n=1 Tax=Eriocheir sinensis TaxID=95602 RepID=UPI0021C69801|nr:uncharacterized protein LOC126993828 isoform X2 [Eriocheir sinensis]XP_050708924.1 uncharacterized protein LOC126993828 isoform X2 [Eriocheir sinensis]
MSVWSLDTSRGRWQKWTWLCPIRTSLSPVMRSSESLLYRTALTPRTSRSTAGTWPPLPSPWTQPQVFPGGPYSLGSSSSSSSSPCCRGRCRVPAQVNQDGVMALGRLAKQSDLTKLQEWNKKCLRLQFSQEKCQVLHLGRGYPAHQYHMGNTLLSTTEAE